MFTPEQLTQLREQLNQTAGDGSGRSPFRPRQLHDLRLLPTATDPRPTFFWSAETPRDFVPGPPKEFPKLMWHRETGEEITVRSFAEQEAHLDLFTLDCPAAAVQQTPSEILAEQLNDLTQAEREAILGEANRQRMAGLTERLAALSPDQLERVLAQAAEPKRRPGRPRKVAG